MSASAFQGIVLQKEFQKYPLDSQLKRRVVLFVAFFVNIYQSTYITDVTQLDIFTCGVDETLTFTEEFLKLIPMLNSTTAEDMFCAAVGVLDRVGVDGSYTVILATDRAPSVVGKKTGEVTRFQKKVRAANRGVEFLHFMC